MSKRSKGTLSRPTVETIEKEIERLKKSAALRKVVADTLRALLVVAAVTLIISNLWLPVFQIAGSNMEPALQNGDVVLSVKRAEFQRGDVIVFYYNNKILVKRVIAQGGEVVDIAEDGTVSVNGKALDEPYVSGKSLGKCDLTFPYTVPAKTLFVMGDDRASSVDSRASMLGPVSPEQVVGKVIFRIWPLHSADKVR